MWTDTFCLCKCARALQLIGVQEHDLCKCMRGQTYVYVNLFFRPIRQVVLLEARASGLVSAWRTQTAPRPWAARVIACLVTTKMAASV